MRTRYRVFLAAAVLLLGALLAVRCAAGYFRDPVPSGQPTPAPQDEGWVNLLDEEHASAWQNITDDKDIFGLEDGLLHIYGRTIYPLRYVGYTRKTFADFDLHLEFRLASRANSGVFLRALRDDPVYRGIEIQVLDDHGRRPSKNGTGGIYDVVTPMFNMARPAGEWNSYDISLRSSRIKVVVNGWKVIDTDFALMDRPLGKFDLPLSELPKEGLIALQDHGGVVWYRNILIRPVDENNESASRDANRIEETETSQGVVPAASGP